MASKDTVKLLSADSPSIKNNLLMIALNNFYGKKENLDRFIEIISSNSVKMSLRIIDWFVTNYSKKHNTSYIQNKNQFIVYLDYKRRLKAYSKKAFDPFCRRQ